MNNNNVYTPINLGNPEEYTILEIANKIRSLINPNLEFEFKPLPLDDPLKRQPCIKKAKKTLNWEPKINLDKGIRKTIDWFKQYLMRK